MEKVKNKIFSCEDCEMAIIAGSHETDPAAAEHLKNCSNCREFAEFQATVLQTEPVISGDIPGFAQVRSAQRCQKRLRFRYLKFIVLPTAAAAALCISAAGLFWQMQNSREQTVDDIGYTIFADTDAFVALLEESSVTLAWDQPTQRSTQAGNLMRDLRESSNWNIELFNPYNEEIQ